MSKEVLLIERMKARLHSAEVMKKYRETEKAFSRKRVLTFGRTVLMILRGHKHSIQNGLNKVFEELGQLKAVPTAAAYSKARRKVKAAVLIEMNRDLSQDYYQTYGADNEVGLWHGRRLLGFDGTILNMPDTPELRTAYSVQSNQYTTYVQGQAGVLYDLRNDLGLAAALGPLQSEAGMLMGDPVWQATQPGDVLVMDRNFVQYGLIAFALKDKRDVIIRCPKRGFKEMLAFWDSTDVERIVTLHMPDTPETRQLAHTHALPHSIQVRLIKVTLSTGEIEVLLTTLCDTLAYPRHEFQQVYGWRWNEETYFNRLKYIFDVERFSGISHHIIEQDFFGVIFLTTLESILTQRPQAHLQALDLERQNQTRAKVNRAVSYVALINHVVELLADPDASPQQTLDELHFLFLRSPTRHRLSRQFPRPDLKHSRRLRFHRYSKRVIA